MFLPTSSRPEFPSTFVVAENPFLIFAVCKHPASAIKCSLVPVGTNIRDTGLLNCTGDINKNPYLAAKLLFTLFM